MFKKNLFLLSIFLIMLLSISVVCAEDSSDAVVLDDANEGIVHTGENNNLELSNCNLASGDAEDADLNSALDDSLETDTISNEVDAEDICTDDEVIINSKTKNALKASYDGPYNVYVDSITARYGSGKYLYLGWEGYFSGYFKVFDSDGYCVHSEYLSGYNKDLQWSLDSLDVDKYTAGLVSTSNYWVKYGTIKITKSSSKISIKSVRTKSGKIYLYAYVKDKYDGEYYNGGKVKMLINGKNYYATVNNGVARVTFYVPKKNKRYYCKATFLGGSNVYSSSTNFRLTIKKHKYYAYKVKTKYKNVYFGKGKYIYGFLLEPYKKKGWILVKSWYGKKRYNEGPAGYYWDLYGKLKKKYKVKVAKYAYY